MMLFSFVPWMVALVACDSTGEQQRIDVFTRASLDLRGYRPSLEEMDKVARSERQLNRTLNSLIEDPIVGEQLLVRWPVSGKQGGGVRS